MKKICTLMVLFALACGFNGNADAVIGWPNQIVRIVDHNYIGDGLTDPNNTACAQNVDGKAVTSYHTTIQGAIDYNHYSQDGTGPGDKIVVCPGTYYENILIAGGWKTPTKHYLQIAAYVPYDPNVPSQPATIVQAADPNKPVFNLNTPASALELSGLTITGATGDNCGTENGNIIVPCSGIRLYCNESVRILGNHITGNHHGVIIKDSAPHWTFLATVSNNTIDNNTVGVKLQYGYGSFIWRNTITTKVDAPNSIGIYLIDTTFNEIAGNRIYRGNSTGTSIEIERSLYDVNGNRFFCNDIYDPVIEDNADCYEDTSWGKTLELNDWYRRLQANPSSYLENNCSGTINVYSNCPSDHYCNPTPYTYTNQTCEDLLGPF